ncbi:DUF4381 domain-containing protein [Aliiglaciecola sp. CAU 1673]|uniref:DUF4381 domain-containing protein n=1 Tax=Aliiglaciecola sp. CAU 1673 TaxID=3032595 RepID=UPI0023DAFDC0|nr:DUF4381 domain-containing protein [Aliiglaciecola sp. CAU 1673]MDF2177106.1 DUF4381 domain-containing protein [Aliiglaciecola sp. CAU 1673]
MNPLEQLKDIHLPEPVSWWPPAPGWWLVALLTLVLITAMIMLWRKRQARRRAIRQALHELQNLDVQSTDALATINGLLKRLTLTYFPREQSAHLHGKAWLDFLASQLPAKQQDSFRQAFGPLLEQLYQKQVSTADLPSYQRLATQWINQALPPKKMKEAKHV